MYKDFTINEFIKSNTADKLCIDNTPNDIVISHINELITNILQPLRDAWGKPIIITSGYRCRALNNAVGGVSNSSHLTGYAADCICDNIAEFNEFVQFIKRFVIDNNIKFDQIIIERKNNKSWVHISIRRNNGQQRQSLFTINK